MIHGKCFVDISQFYFINFNLLLIVNMFAKQNDEIRGF